MFHTKVSVDRLKAIFRTMMLILHGILLNTEMITKGLVLDVLKSI